MSLLCRATIRGSSSFTLSVASGGDVGDKPAFFAALRSFAAPDSPRGPWRFSAAQNPIQDIYLRRVENGRNRYLGVAAEDVADPATGCAL